LLEVLIAVGVFAMAGLGLMIALEATVRGAGAVQRENEIRAQLESRLARLSVGPLQEVATESELEGTLYEEVVAPEEVTDAELTALEGYWKVGVTARWREAGEEQVWAVSHLAYQP
jgi:Tfp pilus assembly protein PilV